MKSLFYYVTKKLHKVQNSNSKIGTTVIGPALVGVADAQRIILMINWDQTRSFLLIQLNFKPLITAYYFTLNTYHASIYISTS